MEQQKLHKYIIVFSVLENLAESQKQRIRQFFQNTFNRELSDAEVIEIAESLYYYVKAKARYILIPKGVIKRAK